MSFGGATSAMITSLKNNKRLRESLFEKKYDDTRLLTEKKFKDHKKITPAVRKAIRERLQRQKRVHTLKVYGLSALIMLVLLLSAI
ncbi:MAG: hypothetical protein WBG71_01405 [Leeuwenhoekiella sp.]